MAENVALQNEIDGLWAETRLLREKIARTWELAKSELGGAGGGSFVQAQYLTMATHGDLDYERVPTEGDGIAITDGGAGGAATFAVDLHDTWSGLEFDGGDLRVDLDAAFTWAGSHTFNANVSAADGVTFDGVDISVFKAEYDAHDHGAGDPTQIDHDDLTNVTANQHHNQIHAIDGGDHTLSGSTTGYVMMATGPSAFAFQAQSNIDHDALGGFVANEHIDHSAISIIAGAGMTGGGDLTASRTLNVVAADTSITVNADSIQLPTPGTLSVSSSNAAAAPHMHEIAASWNPGAASALVKTDASGYVQLTGLGIGVACGAANQITMADGGTIGQAAGPLVTFDDTNNYLEITGCKVAVGGATPVGLVTALPSAANPTNGIDTFGLVSSGAYGGGIGLQDGTGDFGIWLDGTGANARFGFGSALGALSSVMGLTNSGNLILNAGVYHNFGGTGGSGGYGFRDNGGTMQVKHSGGSWANIGSAPTLAVKADGDTYNGYETCTADGVWQEFTNISVSMTLDVTCNVNVSATAYLAYNGSSWTRGAIRVGYDSTWSPSGNTAECGNVEGDMEASIGVTHCFQSVAAGTYTFKMGRWTAREYTYTRFYLPMLTVIAVPV